MIWRIVRVNYIKTSSRWQLKCNNYTMLFIVTDIQGMGTYCAVLDWLALTRIPLSPGICLQAYRVPLPCLLRKMGTASQVLCKECDHIWSCQLGIGRNKELNTQKSAQGICDNSLRQSALHLDGISQLHRGLVWCKHPHGQWCHQGKLEHRCHIQLLQSLVDRLGTIYFHTLDSFGTFSFVHFLATKRVASHIPCEFLQKI